MESSLAALKLILDRLGISDDISEVDDRIRIQKAIYLTQRIAGIDLGYRFSWYLRGPYSSPLASDYYGLAEALAIGGTDLDDVELKPPVGARLDHLAPHLSVPDHVQLPQHDWLELVASVDYLRRVREYDENDTKSVLQREKSRLYKYYDSAKELLVSVAS